MADWKLQVCNSQYTASILFVNRSKISQKKKRNFSTCYEIMQPMVKYIPKNKNIFYYILQNAILFQSILFQSIFTSLLVQKIILLIPTNTPFHHTSVIFHLPVFCVQPSQQFTPKTSPLT